VPLFFNRGTLTFSKKIYQKERLLKKKKELPAVEEIAPSVASDEDSLSVPPKEVLLPVSDTPYNQ